MTTVKHDRVISHPSVHLSLTKGQRLKLGRNGRDKAFTCLQVQY